MARLYKETCIIWYTSGMNIDLDKDFGQVMPNQIGKTKVSLVEEPFSNYGIYVWQLPSGKIFVDDHGNALSIDSMKDDESRITLLRNEAAWNGQPHGRPLFFPNVRKVSDEEYSEQLDRMSQGYIPSETDLGAFIAAKKTYDEFGTGDE
jgi:hypothetical protein